MCACLWMADRIAWRIGIEMGGGWVAFQSGLAGKRLLFFLNIVNQNEFFYE